MIPIHVVLFSNAIFVATRCCACAVDKIPLSVSLHYRDMSKFKCRFNNMSRYLDRVVCQPVRRLSQTHSRCHVIGLWNHSWHFVTKDGQHIPLLTAWAQHLEAIKVALERNTTCIGIVWYFFIERFSAFLDLQTQISADFDDCHSWQPFRNSFLR